MTAPIVVERADFSDPALARFLQEHLDDMEPTSPPESRHALDLDGLRRPHVRLWTATDAGTIVGTVALAGLEPGHEELKSMRTDPLRRGQGIGGLLLDAALGDARARGVRRVSLETGSMDFFAPARRLYERAGFVPCAPFGTYTDDPNSAYFTLVL
ncbi:GNAT family N-acetyltransferase [Leifsonia sp. AG29]|uniref:GNAT family N-acetyltransferase n=1 Tax=Leifsonia sp. AG29 TaxID=2598860 RepID=UPI00131C50B6|nr:GNAT family N-acetyltransferase [Leifsonia sp. AG29]